MPREDVRVRGRRLVSEGRLVLRRVDETEIPAICRGDSGKVHELGYHPDGGWYCGCPARTKCGHLYALQLVTVRPEDPRFVANSNVEEVLA
jgi:hypothetical protein